MCPKDVLDIHIPRRDDDNRLMGLPIIELEFKKDILDPYIIIREERYPTKNEKKETIFM